MSAYTIEQYKNAARKAVAAGNLNAAEELAQAGMALQNQGEQSPAKPTGDTSMGTAFKVGDAGAVSASQAGMASLNRNLDNSFVGDAFRYVGENIANPVRQAVGLDALDYNQIQADQQEKLDKAANVSADYLEKLQEDLNFQNLETSDIKDLGSFVNYVAQKGAQAAPYMGSILASGGTLTYPFMVGEVSQSLDEIEGLDQAQKDDIAAVGGAVMAALENLGIGKLLPKGTSNKIIGGIAKGIVTEGTTEGMQELVLIGSEAVAGKQFGEGEILNRLKESAAAGAVVGGSFKGGLTTGAKVKSLFTSDGSLISEGDLSNLPESEKFAAADVSRLLDEVSKANGYKLKNVDPSSNKGAKQALEDVRSSNVQAINDLRKVLSKRLDPKNAQSLEELLSVYSEASAGIGAGKKKVSQKVTEKQIQAIQQLVGNTKEGQQLVQELVKSNVITNLFKDGMKGGVSQFTDLFNPLSHSGAVYDPTRYANVFIGGTSAYGTGGASLGIAAGGRVVDFFTGRRSKVAKFVKSNKKALGLPDPEGTSIIEQKAQQKAAAKDRRAAIAQIATILDAPKAGFVENILLGTGLDRSGLETVLNDMAGKFGSNPDFVAILDDIQKNLDGEGVAYLDNLSEIIPVIGAYAQKNNPDLVTNTPDNPLLKRSFDGPNVQTDMPNMGGGGTQSGPQFTTPENYNRGIQDNLDFVRTLQEGAGKDKKLSRVDRGRLITSLENLTNNLGSNPVETVQTEVQKLQDQGVNQDAIDTYVKPYVDRVVRQQRPKGLQAAVDAGVAPNLDALQAKLREARGNLEESTPDPETGLTPQDEAEIRADAEAFGERLTEIFNKNKKPRLSMEPFENQPTVPELWTTPPQAYDSAATSINKNKNPAGYTKLKKQGVFKEGQTVVDIGGGRFDNVVDELAKEGVTVKIYDPFNRTPEHNAQVASEVADGKADVAVSNNTLNVIQEPENMSRVIQQAHNAIPTGAKAYFTVYEGSRDSLGKETTQGYQRNEPVTSYIPRLEQVFGKGNVERKGDLLIATKEDAPVRFNEQSPILSDRALGSENTISTRFPTQAASQEDPIKDRLIVDTESMKATPAAFEHNMDLVTEYVNFPTADVQNKDPDAIADSFKEHIISNLLFLHDQVPQEIRDRSKKWYDGARKITTKWSEKYNVPDTGIAGALAALSPQKDWYQNVSLAERVLDVMTGKMDTLWTETMNETAAKIFGKPQYAEDLVEIQGKTLKDVMDMDDNHLAAMWIRTFDEAHNDRRYRTVSSEGDFIGEPSGVAAWGSLNEIGKAVAVIRDPSYANVSPQMGARHKVRNFYNNIISPNNNKGDVTIDTHAVAAALLRALSGNSTEVVHNFGTSLPKAKQPEGYRAAKASGIMGSQGLYGLYADAYREAAAQRGIKPRELQSITWEAVRGLFPAKWKQKKNNVESVNNVWSKHKNGDITLDQARKQILDLAGGINDPTWYNRSNGTKDVETRDSSYEGELDRPSVAGDASGMDSGTRGGNTRLSQEPTGSAGILFRNASQSAASRRSSGRDTVPTTEEVKQAVEPVKAVLEIGSPDGEFSDGIKDLDGVRRLAEAINVVINIHKTQEDLVKSVGKAAEGRNISGAYYEGVADVLQTGATTQTKRMAKFDTYITALHEVMHGLSDQFYNPDILANMDSETRLKFEGRIAAGKDYGTNKVTGRKEIVSTGSFDGFIAGLTTGKTKVPNNVRKKILAEMLDLQKNGYFRSQDGRVMDVRNRRAMETNPQFKKYVRNAPETAVDVIIYYAHDPKRMKREYPNLAKMVKGFFSQSSKVQFFSHPLAMAIAVVYAMLLKQEQADEEDRQMPPGALSPQQQMMAPGALTA